MFKAMDGSKEIKLIKVTRHVLLVSWKRQKLCHIRMKMTRESTGTKAVL